mmetsp:Transcript_19904/g.40451  ORF Transcript_19904/g.40451 Transcript_19904/m.40451 type:complete len:201 (-) Transcript_19904:516-1118(-)
MIPLSTLLLSDPSVASTRCRYAASNAAPHAVPSSAEESSVTLASKTSANTCPSSGVLVIPPLSTSSVRGYPCALSTSLPSFRLNMTLSNDALTALPASALVVSSPYRPADPPLVTSRPGSSSINGKASNPPQSGAACRTRGMTAWNTSALLLILDLALSPSPPPFPPPKTVPNISRTVFMKVVPFRNQIILIGLPSAAQK